MSGAARVAMQPLPMQPLPMQPGLDAPARPAVTLTLAGFAAGVLLNLQHIAWWVIPLTLATIAWRARISWTTHRLPSRAQRITLVIVLTLATVLSLRALNGLGAGATMLAAMAAAKLTETRRTRDWAIILGTSFFLLVTACLDRQALWRAPLYAADVWLLCTAMRMLGSGNVAAGGIWTQARRSGRALLWALPLAILLFLFFPRLPGAFWALPQSGDAISGLGEEMSPGSISRLSESDEPAMRVRFTGALPPPAERYWRGPVLHDFDGYTWRRRPGQFGRPPKLQFSGNAYDYDVTLEPATHGVLIALELPVDPGNAGGSFTQYSGDYQLLTPRPISQTRSYHLTSYTSHVDAEPLSDYARHIDLALPARRNPRALELGERLRAGAPDDTGFVAATIDYFRNGGFEYTLTPPRLSLDSVDDFLFGTRQGFCGHFASSFVTLMRAGGVPARVVTGYLGGEWNPLGQYLVLRQSHAHAWAEVWLPERGWVRVDPTAVVAPERLTRDVFDLIDGAARSPGRVLREAPWLGSAIQAFDALNAWWQDRVVGFDFRSQLGFMQRLGLDEAGWRGIAAVLGAGAGLWLAWIAWSLRDALRPLRPDPLARLWQQLDRRLTRIGVQRAPHEGPLAFAARAGRLRPALAEPLHEIARQYAALRFGPPPADPAGELAQLRAAIRSLRAA